MSLNLPPIREPIVEVVWDPRTQKFVLTPMSLNWKQWFSDLMVQIDTVAGGGTPGPPGPPGADGAPGSIGATGPAGIPGLLGFSLDGLDGMDGQDGIPGLPGNTGATGSVGPAGLTGPPGIDGLEGEAGELGFQGPPGQAGPQGLTGTAGAQPDDRLALLNYAFQRIKFLEQIAGLDAIPNDIWVPEQVALLDDNVQIIGG